MSAAASPVDAKYSCGGSSAPALCEPKRTFDEVTTVDLGFVLGGVSSLTSGLA
jgi:hypothetical protein